VVSICQNGNEHSVLMKDGEELDLLSEYQLFKTKCFVAEAVVAISYRASSGYEMYVRISNFYGGESSEGGLILGEPLLQQLHSGKGPRDTTQDQDKLFITDSECTFCNCRCNQSHSQHFRFRDIYFK
jgi:hypothetical protein